MAWVIYIIALVTFASNGKDTREQEVNIKKCFFENHSSMSLIKILSKILEITKSLSFSLFFKVNEFRFLKRIFTMTTLGTNVTNFE